MNKLKLISDLTRALPTLIDSISKDVKALGSHATFEQDEEPSICLTVATDGNEWSTKQEITHLWVLHIFSHIGP